jgi:hypothetical protein
MVFRHGSARKFLIMGKRLEPSADHRLLGISLGVPYTALEDKVGEALPTIQSAWAFWADSDFWVGQPPWCFRIVLVVKEETVSHADTYRTHWKHSSIRATAIRDG